MSSNRDTFDSLPDPAEFDLDWMAFCYLSEELSEAERESFEARLAIDQGLREALAQAVELTAALQFPISLSAQPRTALVDSGMVSAPASAVGMVQTRSFESWMRATAWVAIAGAACLAVVVGMWAARRDGVQAGANPSETALVWSQVRATWPESAVADALSVGGANGANLLDGADEFDDEAESHVENELNSELPDWLLAAVAGSSGAGSGGEEDESPAAPEHDPSAIDRQEL